MNYYEFYEYIRRLHTFVESQDVKIKQLEKSVQTLTEEITSLKNKPAMQIEKIEYKFDQLKVETLEGTLNIGLNPTDLQGIEDFTVEGKQPAANPLGPANLFQSTMRIEQEALKNLDSQIELVINQYQTNKQVKIDDSYITFIKDDIRKQLPTRIQFHLNQLPLEQRNNIHEENLENRILDLIKKDVQNGIIVFLDNLPDEAKGRNKL
jgi:spore germination protein PC